MTRYFYLTRLYRTAAVLLILGLFTVGSIPAAGQAFHGTMHWVAHLSSYALISFFFGLGWQGIRATNIAVIVASIGFVHELTEIVTHGHGLETQDIVVNAMGALIGGAILGALRKSKSMR